MQMASKLIKLDLDYSCDASHAYQQQRHYVSPWQGESAEHFAKRLLAYLSLYELHPSFAKDNSAGKAPDLYIQDQQQHFQLWCQLELVPEKRRLRASHLADQLLLVLDEQETSKAQHDQWPANQRIFTLSSAQLAEFCLMLKSHMKLSVWREDPLLSITDGEHLLQLNLAALLEKPH
ncbi:YaeQ family protein [Rheinheimera oceanensis]|uniref:YaeQ family protein n=1 Tax=Rheinheimera oceanensis TaxID=2817449 RepID=UPI001BFD4C58|nr:YaeQ family protein [Rheinheimera oceanensis]